jgi:hypothetical protein
MTVSEPELPHALYWVSIYRDRKAWAHRAQSSHQNVICNRLASVEFLEQATKVRSCGDMIG